MNKALFLDRDGIINEDFGYVFEVEKLKILEGIVQLCQKAQGLGYLLIIVTNQSGVGRGYYTEEQFFAFMEAIYAEFQKYGFVFDGMYFAPHHPDSKEERYQKGEEFRKPNTGMILQAQKDFNINLAQSVLIGDKPTDILAGLNAGIGRNILCLGGVFTNIL